MSKHDLVVIGGGPGGYVAALRAAQLGLDVACVEAEAALGGTCLRVGCIPSKALLESSGHFHAAQAEFGRHGIKVGEVTLDVGEMMKRKTQIVTALTKGVAALFKKNKITRYVGHGWFRDARTVVVAGAEGEVELQAERVLIATGSKSAPLKGVAVDGELVGTSTAALSYESVPEHLVVIGAGYIGLELGLVWRRLGARVTVLEYLDRILPGTDGEIAAEALKLFRKQGLEFHLSSRVVGTERKGDKVVVQLEGAEAVECDRVLLAVGRRPNSDDLGLEQVGVRTDERGFVVVDEHYRTNVENVYAIGDVIGGPMLAHKAEEEGVACVERIVTGYGHVNYAAIPGVCYTEPEIAGVGQTEEQLKEAGVDYRKGEFQFRGNGRARALGQVEGRVKVLADARTDRILGVHIIGPRAGDLIAEAAAAIEFGATSEDVARTCHAHPTLSEALKEAALAVDGRALHA